MKANIIDLLFLIDAGSLKTTDGNYPIILIDYRSVAERHYSTTYVLARSCIKLSDGLWKTKL